MSPCRLPIPRYATSKIGSSRRRCTIAPTARHCSGVGSAPQPPTSWLRADHPNAQIFGELRRPYSFVSRVADPCFTVTVNSASKWYGASYRTQTYHVPDDGTVSLPLATPAAAAGACSSDLREAKELENVAPK